MLLALLGLACSTPAPPPAPAGAKTGPDILLITIDALRADRVGAYGDPLARTPTLDALAASGVLFREAHAVSPLCLPATASLLTGLFPQRLGVRSDSGDHLDPAVPTLAGRLSGAGWQTAAFVSATTLNRSAGLSAGFQTFDNSSTPVVANAEEGTTDGAADAEAVNAALGWWRTHSDAPRFAWVHLAAPLAPYTPPPGWDQDSYRGEVHRADALAARLVAAAGPDALIVATADHGEGLWDHGEREHGLLLGRAVTRVPLLVRPPGGLKGTAAVDNRPGGPLVVHRPAGVDADLVLDPVPDAPRAARVIDQAVSGVDLTPTVLDYAGLSLPGADGRSLRSLVEGAELPDAPIYAETWQPVADYGWAPLAMTQSGQRRVERGTHDLIIDLGSDPYGTAAAQQPAAADDALARWVGVASSDAPLHPASDPRDLVALAEELRQASALTPPAAVVALRRLRDLHPDAPLCHQQLAQAERAAGDASAAAATLAPALLRWPDHGGLLTEAGALYLATNQTDAARAIAQSMLDRNPNDVGAHRLRAAAAHAAEDPAALREAAGAGLLAAPGDAPLLYLLALSELNTDAPVQAITHFAAARQAGSHEPELNLWRAVALERSGDIDQARLAYLDATRDMPDDPRPYALAGWMLYKNGRCAEARSFLVNVAARGGASNPAVAEALAACQSERDVQGLLP
jgi:arylsulfatase A-like enzyme/Flp pilus assembly protein TadD